MIPLLKNSNPNMLPVTVSVNNFFFAKSPQQMVLTNLVNRTQTVDPSASFWEFVNQPENRDKSVFHFNPNRLAQNVALFNEKFPFVKP